jgi:AraC-like DNA-binding protein
MLATRENSHAEILAACTEESYYKAEVLWKCHSLMRIVTGEMKIVEANNTHIFGPGDTILVPRNQLAMVVKRSKDGLPYRSILVTFTPERLKEYYAGKKTRSNGPPVQKIRAFEKGPLMDSYFAALMPYFDLQQKLPETIVSLKIEEAIAIFRSVDSDIDSLLANFSEPGKIDLTAFMEKNFMFNMHLEKFAYLTGRSIATFNRDFKKAFNISPQKWLTRKRLELAHYQITQQQRKPSDIYLETGFENLSHFSHAFKKHFGYTTSELVQQQTKDSELISL